MRVGFTCGSYDLFHAGHVLALKASRAQCDYLIVGLQSDPSVDRADKNTPVQTVGERLVQLQGCRYVDEIWHYSTEKDLYNFLHQNNYRIDIRFLGEDWRGKKFTGHELLIPCEFTLRDHTYSSSDLRKRVVRAEFSKPGGKLQTIPHHADWKSHYDR